MKKLVLLVACLVFGVSLTAGAAPLNDYSQGKVTIDANGGQFNLHTSSNNSAVGSNKYKKKLTFDYGMTEGLGDKYAIQYKNQRFDANHSLAGGTKMNARGNAQELNLLYKLGNNISAFAGANRITGAMDISGMDHAADIKSTTSAHYGLLASAKFSDSVTGWALASTGKNNRTYEIGLGHQVSEDAEFNVFYRAKRFNKLQVSGADGDFDARTEGYGFGMTYKI